MRERLAGRQADRDEPEMLKRKLNNALTRAHTSQNAIQQVLHTRCTRKTGRQFDLIKWKLLIIICWHRVTARYSNASAPPPRFCVVRGEAVVEFMKQSTNQANNADKTTQRPLTFRIAATFYVSSSDANTIVLKRRNSKIRPQPNETASATTIPALTQIH